MLSLKTPCFKYIIAFSLGPRTNNTALAAWRPVLDKPSDSYLGSRGAQRVTFIYIFKNDPQSTDK